METRSLSKYCKDMVKQKNVYKLEKSSFWFLIYFFSKENTGGDMPLQQTKKMHLISVGHKKNTALVNSLASVLHQCSRFNQLQVIATILKHEFSFFHRSPSLLFYLFVCLFFQAVKSAACEPHTLSESVGGYFYKGLFPKYTARPITDTLTASHLTHQAVSGH